MVKKAIQLWNDFFFKPTSPATLGLFRIALGCVAVLSTIGRYPVRDLFYSDEGIVKYHTIGQFFPPFPWLYFRWMPNQEPGLTYFFIAVLIIATLFTLGLFTRLSTILLFIGVISLSNRNFFIDNAGDHLLRINLFFLMFSRCGDAFSLDRLIAVRRGKASKELTPSAPWARRLLQIQLAYLYIDTVYLKLHGELWRDGTAMYYALNYMELRRFEFKPLFYYLWQIKLMTYVTLMGETSLGTLIWFRKFRYPLIVVGFIFHEGINLTMQFPIFQYVMMASLLNFIYPEDLERWWARVAPRLKRLAQTPSFLKQETQLNR